MTTVTHRFMTDAFIQHLQQQLDSQRYIIQSEKKLPPLERRPDIAVCDMEKEQTYVIEFVHTHDNVKAMREVHEQYQAAGIIDLWIFWGEAEPKMKTDPIPDRQGLLLPQVFEGPSFVTLTQPMKTVLGFSTNYPKNLYFFTDNMSSIDITETDSEMLRLAMIGFTVYYFADENAVEQGCRELDFVQWAAMNIVLGEEIRFEKREVMNEKLLEGVFDRIKVNQSLSKQELMDQMVKLVENPGTLMQILLESYAQNFLSEEQIELLKNNEGDGHQKSDLPKIAQSTKFGTSDEIATLLQSMASSKDLDLLRLFETILPKLPPELLEGKSDWMGGHPFFTSHNGSE